VSILGRMSGLLLVLTQTVALWIDSLRAAVRNMEVAGLLWLGPSAFLLAG
jgi:hypothetical protein